MGAFICMVLSRTQISIRFVRQASVYAIGILGIVSFLLGTPCFGLSLDPLWQIEEGQEEEGGGDEDRKSKKDLCSGAVESGAYDPLTKSCSDPQAMAYCLCIATGDYNFICMIDNLKKIAVCAKFVLAADPSLSEKQAASAVLLYPRL